MSAWCFCNSLKEHIAEFDADMRVLRFRPASDMERQQFKAFVLYRGVFIANCVFDGRVEYTANVRFEHCYFRAGKPEVWKDSPTTGGGGAPEP